MPAPRKKKEYKVGDLYVPKDFSYFLEGHKQRVAKVTQVEDEFIWYVFLGCACNECSSMSWNLTRNAFGNKFKKLKMEDTGVKAKYVF